MSRPAAESSISCFSLRSRVSSRFALITRWIAVRLVMSAKREETRERRLKQLIDDSAAGRDIKQLRRA